MALAFLVNYGHWYYPLNWQAALEFFGPRRYDTTLKLIDFHFLVLVMGGVQIATPL